MNRQVILDNMSINEKSKTMKTLEELDNEIKELRNVVEELKILINGELKHPYYEATCDRCGCHPTVLYQSETGRFCKNCN